MPLWVPSPTRRDRARLTAFTRWLNEQEGLAFADYESLWHWSVERPDAFWGAVVRYFAIREYTAHQRVLEAAPMPGARWFPGATVNFVDQVFRHRSSAHPAIVHYSEALGDGETSWDELEQSVAVLAVRLRALGVGPGDRVAACLPNVPQAVIAFLAAASIGAVWSLCSPDMGVTSITDRFRQIEPRVLIAVDGYRHAGEAHERTAVIGDILAQLPTVQTLVWLPLLAAAASPPATTVAVLPWHEALRPDPTAPHTVEAVPVPFDHPLWVVFSSGTTGLPKVIVHGHGGMLAAGLVTVALHCDLDDNDRFFWYSSSGWIMWNIQVMGLLVGSTIALYDGAVTGADAPDLLALWRWVATRRITLFGAGAAFLAACARADLAPGRDLDLATLRTLGSTGSPLSDETYHWVYRAVDRDVWLLCMSGGTDIAGAFLTGAPTLPLYAGEMQCRNLGAAVAAYDESGQETIGSVGELVCARPLPSMPLRFWKDPEDRRYRESYFEVFWDAHGDPVWRHGDWLKLVRRPHAIGGIIYGRSDATVNRNGIRIGTSELYAAVDTHADVADSLVIDLEYLGRPPYMALFVAPAPGRTVTPALAAELNARIRTAVSPRFVPDEVVECPAVPRTLTGKKLEVPIKRLLLGAPAERVLQRDAVINPECLDWYVAFAARRLNREE